jgi:hypothetical protein
MIGTRHLSEDERHDAADGSLALDHSAEVNAHLGACAECAADVARIKQLMTRIQQTPAPQQPDLWPEIRSRIEREKVVQLPAADVRVRRPRSMRLVWGALALAAALVIGVVLPNLRREPSAPNVATAPKTTPTSPSVALVADSADAYEQEAKYLLNDLEMRRAMMRPQMAAAVDRDLKVIDQAIAELKEAIARDPNNPALRRMLASSYKQKVELLKRAVSAG